MPHLRSISKKATRQVHVSSYMNLVGLDVYRAKRTDEQSFKIGNLRNAKYKLSLKEHKRQVGGNEKW